ncbi:MAG TPA: GvpL/GvpF family gas vesicle protein [Longimicrobium sp.]|nr:GvpL/GvpF family gas vesicle protein [Longimicrobium sp.]
MSDDRPPTPPPSPEAPRPAPPLNDGAGAAAAPVAATGTRAERRRAPRGLSLLAVLPADTDDPDWDPVDPKLGAKLLMHEDLAALVAPAPPHGSDSDALHVTARHWEVHRALLSGDVVPAPCGAVFTGDADVLAFLEASYTALRGALARVRGRWEYRLHVALADPSFPETRALDLATHIYAELRRLSRSAVPFPREAPRILSAAFLVERAASEAFRDRVDQLSALNTALELDLTGPWPPYDFVTMIPPPPLEAQTGAAAPAVKPATGGH